jgi:hypothetical protein
MGLLDNLDAMMDWLDRRTYGAERGSADSYQQRDGHVYGAPRYGSTFLPPGSLSQPLAGLMPFGSMANAQAYSLPIFGEAGRYNLTEGPVRSMLPDSYCSGGLAPAYPRWNVAPPAPMAADENESREAHAPRLHHDIGGHHRGWLAPGVDHSHLGPRPDASFVSYRLRPVTADEEAAQLNEALRRCVMQAVPATATAMPLARPAQAALPHAPSYHDFERERVDTLFACMDSLNLAHLPDEPYEATRDWSLESSEFAHLYASAEGRRIYEESAAATRAAGVHLREAMQAAGMTPVPNDGKAHDSTNNCLLISLLQHATRDYGSDHAQLVSQYREIMTEVRDAPLARNAPISALSLAAKRLVELINADPGMSPKLRVAFVSEFDGRMRVDEIGAKEPDARTVVVWDQGGHFEAVVPAEIAKLAFAGHSVASHQPVS